VPKGTAAAVGRFYAHFLGAAVTRRDAGSSSGPGYSVHFSMGDHLRQTMTFLEEDGQDAGSADSDDICEVVVYMPSEMKFSESFTRCLEAGLVEGPSTLWDDVKEAKQFVVNRCYDPNSEKAPIKLSHVIRHPDHPELSFVVPTLVLAQEV